MKRFTLLLVGLSALLGSLNAHATDPVTADVWSGVTAGAAMGYCLANHPYRSNSSAPFTLDGFEKVAPPGIVGVIRRNYVENRTTLSKDEGQGQSCAAACKQFGLSYGPKLVGKPLRQELQNGVTIESGIGDMAALALPDHDFYMNKLTVSGMASRGNTWHTADVSQADFCCCHVVYQ